ncbi:MAG: cyanophycin synthetase family protein [Armatimonadota bacterium]
MKVVEVVFSNGKKARLTVEMPDPDRCTTDKVPHIPKQLFKMFPNLAAHRCDNGNGHSFFEECQATEIPHLLEHLIIEIQGQAFPHTQLSGETHWNWQVDPRGRFYVYVEYENELLALGAIRLAEKIINAISNRRLDQIDTEAEIKKLRRIAFLYNRQSIPRKKPVSPAGRGGRKEQQSV